MSIRGTLARRLATTVVLALVVTTFVGLGRVARPPAGPHLVATAGTWTPTDSMAKERYGQSATLLTTGPHAGGVLVAGGVVCSVNFTLFRSEGMTQPAASRACGSIATTATAQIYLPSSGTWIAAPGMHDRRAFHTATTLPGGRVLVAGGLGVQDSCSSGASPSPGSSSTPSPPRAATGSGLLSLRSSEIYDPVSDGWEFSAATSCMDSGRAFHTATAATTTGLGSSVVVLGGRMTNGSAAGVPEVFVPATGWQAIDVSMHSPRWSHTASLLPDGRILVAGGFDANQDRPRGAISSVEIFEPNRQPLPRFTVLAPLSTPRACHTATLLSSGPNAGRVLIAGGAPSTTDSLLVACDGQAASSAEVFDVAQNRTSPAPDMPSPMAGHSATTLTDGTVLVAGGYNGRNPFTSNATPGTAPATLIASAAVSALYDPTVAPFGSWSLTGSLTQERVFHTATLLTDGRVLAAGGIDTVSNENSGQYNILSSAELYATPFSPTSTPPTTPTVPGALPPPQLSVSPPLGPPGTVLTVSGSDFTGCVTLQWQGNSAQANSAPQCSGSFTIIMLVFPHETLGARILVGTGTDARQATAPFLLVPGTEQPPGFLTRH